VKRVLVVTPWSGGFVDVQLGLLREAGHDVRVLRLTVTAGPRWWVVACALLQAAFYRGPRSHRVGAWAEVVHAYGAWPAGLAGHYLSHNWNVPLIIHEHLSPPERLRRLPLAVAVLEDCDRILSPSEGHAAEVSRIAGGRHVEVVPNPVVTGYQDLGCPTGPSRVVCVGRLEGQKGFDRIALASRYHEDATFYFVGAGSQEKGLRSLVNGNAVFVPPVDHADAMRWLRSADVVACPSRHESFGLVAAEAAAMGKPVVATDVGVHAAVATELVPQDAGPREWAAALKRASFAPRLPRLVPGSAPDAFVAAMGRAYEVQRGGDE
jgi:D-inositol-3-phosphate glycosyltransferase